MGKDKGSKTAGLAMIAVVTVALAVAYFGAFGSFEAWARRYEAWQLSQLLVASILLAVVFVLYHRRETSRLRRETAERQREVAEVEREVADLRQAKEALQRNEARYRGVVAGLPVALFAVDSEGVFTLSEGRGLDALGLEPEKVVGRPIFEMHREAPQIVENVRLALAGKAFDATVEVGGRAFETRYSPLRDNGEFSGVLGVATDITERKEAEDQLRAAEARYRTLVEQVPTISYIEELSEKGKRLTYISPQYEATFGYSLESAVSYPEHWLEIVHPDDSERLLAEDIRTDETLEPFRAEYRMFAKDGRVLWIRDEAVVVRDEGGRPLFWQGVMFDVTEQKRSEEELEESRRRLSTLLSNAPAYLYRCRNEPGWPNEFVSDHAFELTGHTPEELTDGSVMYADLIVEEDRERVWEEVQAGLAERRRFELWYSVRRKDGEVRHVEERGQGIYGEDGRVEAIEGVVYDVTERVRAEEALKESEERYRRLSGELTLLHQVRTALAQELDLRSVFHGVVEAIAETYGYTQVSAYLLEGEELVLQHQVGYERVIERIPLTEGVSGRTVRTGEPVLVEDVHAERDFLGTIENITSEICVPLFDEGEAVGFINVESKDSVKLTQKDLELMVTLGEHMSVALGRARLHTQVRRSEERLRSLADAAFEGILISDESEILEANRALADMLGYEVAEMVGRSALEFVAPEHRDLVRQKISSGAEDPYEIIGIGKDGMLLDLEVRGRAFSYQGRTVRVTAVRDITERKAAEERLKEAEERYRTLVERIPAVTFVDRAEGSEEALYVSPQVEGMLGYTPEEWMEGRLWRESLHPDDRERILASDERFETDGEPVNEEYRLLTKDGSVVWVREETVLVRGGGGEPLYVQGILTDVTEHKEAEERVRTSEAELRALFEAMTDLIFEIDWEGRYLKIAPTNPALLYRPPGELLGKTLHEVMPTEQADMFRDHIRRALQTRRKVDTEYSLTIGDKEVWFAGTIAPMAEDRVVFVARDITERKAAEEALRKSEERYRLVAQATNEVIWDNDLTTGAQVWDGATEAMFGYPPEEMEDTAEWWEEHIHPDDRERVLANTEAILSSGEDTLVAEYRFRRADGAYVTLVDRAYVLRDAEGRPVRMLGSIMDVTERRRAEEALRRSQVGLAEAQRMAHLGNWEWDPRTGETYWSDETFRIYGFEPQSFVPTFERLLEVVHPDDRKMLGQALEAALYDDRPYDFEHRVVKPDGEARVVHRRAEVVRDESGEPARMVGTVHDVTERKAMEEQLQYQAMHDPLTGLPNRALFTDRLRQALTRAKRREGEVAVLFMDLDNFKVVNDSLGHKAGDRLLVAAGKRISTLLRPEDTVARLGGDEFVFLLEDTGVQGAVRVAERVLDRLREPFSLGRRRLVVTASIGVAAGGADGKYAADLLRDADLAMYRAKRSGKARHAVFEEAMNAEALERLELEHDLRRGIERGELRVHYQPQMRLDANLQRSLRARGSRAIVSFKPPREPRVTGVEALVRWEHPERGLLLPRDFVPVAEETGLIVPMGEAVLEEACRQAKDWQGRVGGEAPLDVYVNLSARQFREPDLPETVSRILQETDLNPACLHLEITETTAMSDAPTTVSTLEELKALGVRLVIDDFGTGYSSLSYLQRFPVDYVKIDRSFVEGIETDPGAMTLVSGMIGLAHALGIEVIAEGVERAGQVERLGAMGCDLAQGYYFSGPLLGELMGVLLEDSATE